MNTPHSVLIVEDEAVLRDAYKIVLSRNGYTVYTASNGAEGLLVLRKTPPDVVLLDIFMPVMDGKEFMKNVDVSEYPNTKFVVWSNLSDRGTETEMRELGAHAFVLKSSMAPQNLLDLVEQMTQTPH